MSTTFGILNQSPPQNVLLLLLLTSIERVPRDRDWCDIHSGQTQKATSLLVFQSLKVWISSNGDERDVSMRTIHKMSWQTEFLADKICGCQLLHFEHTLSVKSLIILKVVHLVLEGLILFNLLSLQSWPSLGLSCNPFPKPLDVFA